MFNAAFDSQTACPGSYLVCRPAMQMAGNSSNANNAAKRLKEILGNRATAIAETDRIFTSIIHSPKMKFDPPFPEKFRQSILLSKPPYRHCLLVLLSCYSDSACAL